LAPSRQRVDDAGKQYRERPPSAAVREAADEHDVVSAAAVTTRQQLQAQYGRAEVDLAIAGEDQSAFGTFILAEWAMGAAGLGSLTEASPEASAHVHELLQSDSWAAASSSIVSRYATSNEATHAHLAVELIRRSRGQRLPSDVAARLSAALGVDISEAVIHTDAAAAEAAKAVNAHAFATGKDVFFAAGQYRPGTREGDELLAHELTHVVQDAEGRIPFASGSGLTVSTPNQSHEREAERAGREAAEFLHSPLADAESIESTAPENLASDDQEHATAAHAADGLVSRKEAGVTNESAEEIIDRYTNTFGLNLVEDGLGRYLLSLLPHNVGLVTQTLDAVGSTDRDDVSYYIAHYASDGQLKSIADAPEGTELLMRMMRELQAGFTSGDEAVQMERLTRYGSPTHGRLREEEAAKDPKVAAGLKAEDATLQSIEDGHGDFIYDEYSVVIDAMPPGLTAAEFLAEMATDLNRAVSDDLFNAINVFSRRPTTASPEVGNVYDIDIAGPFNGSVVLVERTEDHFVFQTLTTNSDGSGYETGSHPEYGSREFGFEAQRDGSTKFYTRGASRPSNALVGFGGRLPQSTGWTRLMKGISNAIDARGGRARKQSFSSWTSHR